MQRRNFLKNSTILGLSSVAVSSQILAATSTIDNYKVQDGAIILFQGDSITDAGRNREESKPNNNPALGYGYALQAASTLLLENAERDFKIFNKGISGNKVPDLANRWAKDCIDIKPNVLSVLIGVNDYWHKHNGKYDGTIESYEREYDKLLQETKAALPNVKLIIGEPFAVNGIKAVDDTWYPQFDEYRKVAKKIADKYKAVFIPYQQIFNDASKKVSGAYWTTDGVHATLAGAKLMAESWLKAYKKL